MTASASVLTGPDDVATDTDLPNPPVFNGAAVAGMLRWCQERNAGPYTRLVGAALALVAGPSGVIGPLAIRHVARLTGLSRAIAGDHLRLLKRAGVFRTVEHHGRVPFLILIEEIAAGPNAPPVQAAPALGQGDATSLHSGAPEPATPSSPGPESGAAMIETSPKDKGEDI
jgi:hypothetical protein